MAGFKVNSMCDTCSYVKQQKIRKQDFFEFSKKEMNEYAVTNK